MSKTTGKYIGINQRVPFTVLDRGLLRFLEQGEVDRITLRQDLNQFVQGENRLAKAVIYANQILTKPTSLLQALSRQVSANTYAQLPMHERQAMCLSLLVCAYPIAYDLIVAFGKGFKVQPRISRQYVTERIAAQYGSTRTIDIALDALLPMLIELGVVERAEISIYQLQKAQTINNPFIAQAYTYADLKSSKVKSLLMNEVRVRPWYLFYSPSYSQHVSDSLLKYTEGPVSGGYISTK